MRFGANRTGKGLRGRLLVSLLSVVMATGFAIGHADAAYAADTAAEEDPAGLQAFMRAEAAESRVKITTNQQSDDREVDFVSLCCESGDLDIEMTITYANGEPSKAYMPDYLYVRLDGDGEDGFEWVSPLTDLEGDRLIYSFSMSRGQRAAFWIFDYPQDKESDTPPTLNIKATDREGRQVYGNAVGLFRSNLEDWGDGTFYLSNARVDADAEDKAGLPNAKIVLAVLGDDDNQEPNPDAPDTSDTPEDDSDVEIPWDRKKVPTDTRKVPQLGDATSLISLVVIAISLIAIAMVNRKRK